MGLDFDLESGLGWDTLTERWYVLGGPSSILGTQEGPALFNLTIGTKPFDFWKRC